MSTYFQNLFEKSRHLVDGFGTAKKCNVKSRVFRLSGNTFFRENTTSGYLNALHEYNKAICYADPKTAELCIAYGNRSAAFFQLGLYKACLRDIDLAKNERDFPDWLVTRLTLRAERCQAQPQIETVITLTPRLSFKPHKRVPFIANCLELRKNEKYGRHVITNQDIKVGDIIAIEDAFCTTIQLRNNYTLCYNCGLQNCMSLIPCDNCPFVMFCSEECQDEACKRFHIFECPLMNFIHSNFRNDSTLNVVRAFICGITSFNTFSDLESCIYKESGSDINVFHTNYSSVEQYGHAFGPVLSMQEATPMLCSQKKAEFIEYVAKIILTKSTFRYEVLDDELRDMESLIRRLFYKNMINTSVITRKRNDGFKDSDTKSLYSFHSLLNHSCAPNVVLTGYGNKLIISALRPIKKGEQIFDNYGVSHTTHDLTYRRTTLLFTCECKACLEDYTTLEHACVDEIPFLSVLTVDVIEKIFENHRETAIMYLAEVRNFLQKYDSYYPCKQLLYYGYIYQLMLRLAYDPEIEVKDVVNGAYYRLENHLQKLN